VYIFKNNHEFFKSLRESDNLYALNKREDEVYYNMMDNSCKIEFVKF